MDEQTNVVESEKLELMKSIHALINAIKEDEPAAAKGTKTALRRIRVALSDLSKACKQARVEVLAKMKGEKSE